MKQYDITSNDFYMLNSQEQRWKRLLISVNQVKENQIKSAQALPLLSQLVVAALPINSRGARGVLFQS